MLFTSFRVIQGHPESQDQLENRYVPDINIRLVGKLRCFTWVGSRFLTCLAVGVRLGIKGRISLIPCLEIITPVLSDLHWLPVRHRIDFKIATITFKVLQFQQPSYLAALIPRYVPTRSLRSSSSLSICVPSRKTTMARSKSFSFVASHLWNKLPCHLSSTSPLPAFRKRLKHHLFSSAFPGNPSPSNDIMFYDVSPSTNATQVRHTPPPS